jgi:hypothetical protein
MPLRPVSELGLTDVTDVAVELPAPAASEAAPQRSRRDTSASPGRRGAPPRKQGATRVLGAAGTAVTGGSRGRGTRSAQRRSGEPSVRIYTSPRESAGGGSRASTPRGAGGPRPGRADRSRTRARPADSAGTQARGSASPRHAPRRRPARNRVRRPVSPPQAAGQGELSVADTLKGAALTAVAGVAGGLLLIRTVFRHGT